MSCNGIHALVSYKLLFYNMLLKMLFLNVADFILTLSFDVNRIKKNIRRIPGDRMVTTVKHLCVGYYDSIMKKKAQAHVNE